MKLREAIDLGGVWELLPDVAGEGEAAGYYRPEFPAAAWGTATLPAGFEHCLPGQAHVTGAIWFRRRWTMPAHWTGRRVELAFHGVFARATVWLDGELLGECRDGFLPFAFDLTHRARPGVEHVLTVRVDNSPRPDAVPSLITGWWPVGGILREVVLTATDRLHVARLEMRAVPGAEAGELHWKAIVRNDGDHPREARVVVQVHQVRVDLGQRTLVAGEEVTYTKTMPVPGVAAWSPETPNIYPVDVILLADGTEADSVSQRVGFREVRTSDGRLFLNGEPVFLTGFNYHEDSPRTAMAPDPDLRRRDLEGMKAAGANFVRLAHYPHHPATLDLCDELGLLALAEIPLYMWQLRDAVVPDEQVPLVVATAERQLRAMIARDRHHPSVIMWSVSNECAENRPEVIAANQHLIRVARELDPDRFATHVSNWWLSHPHFEEDDVICLNHYPSWGRRMKPDGHTYRLEESAAHWRDDLERLHGQYPGKPIVVTEFGYPSFVGVPGGSLGEDTQAAAIEHEWTGIRQPFVSGAALWCWADHAWSVRKRGWISSITVSPFGVLTRERKPKAALATIMRLFQVLRLAGGRPWTERGRDPARC